MHAERVEPERHEAERRHGERGGHDHGLDRRADAAHRDRRAGVPETGEQAQERAGAGGRPPREASAERGHAEPQERDEGVVVTTAPGSPAPEREQHQPGGHQADGDPARAAQGVLDPVRGERGHRQRHRDERLGQVEREQPDRDGVQQEPDEVRRDDDHHPAVAQRAGDEAEQPVGRRLGSGVRRLGLHDGRDAEDGRGQQAGRRPSERQRRRLAW